MIFWLYQVLCVNFFGNYTLQCVCKCIVYKKKHDNPCCHNCCWLSPCVKCQSFHLWVTWTSIFPLFLIVAQKRICLPTTLVISHKTLPLYLSTLVGELQHNVLLYRSCGSKMFFFVVLHNVYKDLFPARHQTLHLYLVSYVYELWLVRIANSIRGDEQFRK